MLAKAGLIPSNSLPNKQEDGDEQQKESQANSEGCGDLFDSNSFFDNLSGLPNFSEKHSELDLQNEEKGPLGQRKRRRLIGNLDNTLDGLVAKRADLPLKKRYQSETEAIELPDDEQEMKRMETDPDVCTRMCSVCGYQGKWVSEMIRHKRVHTNDRPFKCKYCNRTSKWKADLIRHVAKTHGIRVVSKYSRSKAFDFGKNSNKSSTEQQLTIDDVIMDVRADDDNCSSEMTTNIVDNNDDDNMMTNSNNNNKIGRKQSTSSSTAFSESLNSMFRKAQRLNGLNKNTSQPINKLTKQKQQRKIKTENLNQNNEGEASSILFNLLSQQLANKQLINATIREQIQQQLCAKNSNVCNNQEQKQQQIYKCGLCIFQQPSYPLLVSHLLGVHNTSPFCCQSCNRSFTQIVSAAEHFATDKCPPNALKWNFLVDSVVGNEHFEANQHPLNLFGQRLAASASNNILFHQNMHQNANFNGFGGLLPPAIFPYGLPTMAFPPQYSGHSIAQLHGIGQNCCSPGSAISTAPSYASLINNNCEKPNQLEKNNEDDNVEIVEDLKREIKSSQSPELKIPAPVPHNSKLQQKHSPLEAETANKNEQNLDDTEDFCVNVDDIKVEEEKSGDELQNEDAIKNTSLAALMLLNVVQMQQKLTALEDVPKTTQPEQVICPTTSTTTTTSATTNPSLAAFSQFLAELQQRTSTASFQ
uniref:C2H2-type domain-containing protein n=1 Tax=Meloidogyne incognita TaxID=6306 RepID=A0A914KXF4_MELIC